MELERIRQLTKVLWREAAALHLYWKEADVDEAAVQDRLLKLIRTVEAIQSEMSRA